MENNNQNNKEEYLLPKEVLTHVNNLIGKGAHTLSTVIETEFYTQEALNRMLEKNEIIWSHKLFNGVGMELKEGLIRFNETFNYLYFIKRKDENTYKFYMICKKVHQIVCYFSYKVIKNLKQYKMRILDSKELKEKINSGEKFIVDMYADWCGPCRMMGKVIETVSDKLSKENHEVKLYKFNIETDKEMATSLNVRSIPMLIGFNDGKSVSVKVGVVPETQIIEMVNNI